MNQLRIGTMVGRYRIFVCTYFLIAIIYNVVYCSDEIENFTKITKKLVSRISSNSTTNDPERATRIQYGNNLFIKPTFIIGSPFKSYKQVNEPDGCCDIGRPPAWPEVPFPPRYPKVVDKPVRPFVIPKPPELPPIILPKLPIEIIIKNPIITNFPSRIPFPNEPVIVSHQCPPMVKCIAPEREIPSIGEIFKIICNKLKNLFTTPNRIDLTNLMVKEEIVLSDIPSAFPTICAHSIITERLVPNIVRIDDNDVNVIMSPISLSQFTSSGIY